MAEFELIKQIQSRLGPGRAETILGIGDDCAVVSQSEDEDLAVCVDTLVAGVHFPIDTSPADIGYKSLAVNLSDLAAMGALPRWATLALTLEKPDSGWIDQFVQGFADAAKPWQVELIGGDTTSGPLTVTVQAAGMLPRHTGLRRSGARVGDAVVVTGTLGDAALALQMLQQECHTIDPVLLQRLNRPTARVEAGIAMRSLANAAIDLSDGLASDLLHVLDASAVGATLEIDRLPCSSQFEHGCAEQDKTRLQMTGGDDYELCATVDKAHLPALLLELERLKCPCTVVGEITSGAKLTLVDRSGQEITLGEAGYEHFVD